MVHSRRRSLSSRAFPFLVQVSLLTRVRHKIPRKSHATNLKMRSGVGVPKGLAATSLASSQTKRRRRRTPRTPRRLENASTNRRNDGSPVSVAGERRHPHVSCVKSAKMHTTVTCEAVAKRLGRTMGFSTCELRDEKGDVVATGSHTKFLGATGPKL